MNFKRIKFLIFIIVCYSHRHIVASFNPSVKINRDQTFLEYLQSKKAKEGEQDKIMATNTPLIANKAALSAMAVRQATKDQQSFSLCSSARLNPRYFFTTHILPYDIRLHRTAVTTLFRKHFDYPASKKFFMPEAGESAWVIKCERLIVGFMVHSYKSKEVVHIEHMAICDTYQGFGFGTELIDTLKQQAKMQNFKSISVCPLSKAEAYYINHGFKKAHSTLNLFSLIL